MWLPFGFLLALSELKQRSFLQVCNEWSIAANKVYWFSVHNGVRVQMQDAWRHSFLSSGSDSAVIIVLQKSKQTNKEKNKNFKLD